MDYGILACETASAQSIKGERVPNAAMTVGGTSSAWIRACVFLLLGEQPAHGYELLTNLEGFGVRCVDSGTLYRVLRRTERDGLTQSRWEPADSGPARRIYVLTAMGRNALDEITADLDHTRALTEAFVARARGLLATVA